MSTKNILLPALTAMLCLGGCSETHFSHVLKTSTSDSSSPVISFDHSYSEVDDLMIEWNQIFEKKLDYYLVYIFASWCNHCNSIKNDIIEYALNRDDFYFINEPSDEATFKNNVTNTIGLTSVTGLAILGYPTLLEIDGHKLTKNISSVDSIAEFIEYAR